MDVRCEKCGTEYEFDDDRVGDRGVTVKCTNCDHVFRITKPDGKKGRDWLVRKSDGRIVAFRQLTTLQKWIVEGRVQRDDEISRNGETWKQLGNIHELEPFFSVFEKASALNDLMSTGAVGDKPVIVNGSEILATMTPMPSTASQPPLPVPPPAADSGRPTPAPPESTTTRPSEPVPGLAPSADIEADLAEDAASEAPSEPLSRPPAPSGDLDSEEEAALDALDPKVPSQPTSAPPPLPSEPAGAMEEDEEDELQPEDLKASDSASWPPRDSLGPPPSSVSPRTATPPPSPSLPSPEIVAASDEDIEDDEEEGFGQLPDDTRQLDLGDEEKTQKLDLVQAVDAQAESNLGLDYFSDGDSDDISDDLETPDPSRDLVPLEDGSQPAPPKPEQGLVLREPSELEHPEPVFDSGPPRPSAPPRGATLAERLRHTVPPTERPSLPPQLVSAGMEMHEASDSLHGFDAPAKTKRKVISMAAILLAVGLGGGAAFAVLGPQENNPLRSLAMTLRLLPGGSEGEQDLVQAYKSLEADTPESLKRADQLFQKLIAEHPKDARLLADRALVLTTRADALRREQAETTRRADAHEEAVLQWKRELKRIELVQKRTKEKIDPPKKPEALDVAALREEAEAQGSEASDLIKEAFGVAKEAYSIDPQGFAVHRALADYYRVQRDIQGLAEKHLQLAKAAAQASGTGDAATLYIEAALTAGTIDGVPVETLQQSKQILEQALTMRPGLQRARVLLARLNLALGDKATAERELKVVLRASPNHEEAKRLLGMEPTTKSSDAGANAAVADAGAPDAKPAPKLPDATPPPSKPDATTPAPKKPAAKADAGTSSPSKPARAHNSYDDWMKQGDLFRQKNQLKEALLAYEKAADRRLNSPYAYAGMGWTYLDLGKSEAAMHVFKKAIRINYGFGPGHLGLATCYRKLGRIPEAIEAYETFIKISPNSTEATAARRAVDQLKAQAPPKPTKTKDGAGNESPKGNEVEAGGDVTPESSDSNEGEQ